MKIVIDIPEETYKYYDMLSNKGEVLGYAERTIMQGIPLPEHHGRLIDADELVKSDCFWETEYEVTNAPTIIEGSDSE